MIENPWNIILGFGFKHEQFNQQYEIYYRSTKYSEKGDWIKARFIWALERHYPNKPNYIECCIQIDDKEAPPWFIKNDKTGYDSLVIIHKPHKDII